MEKNVDFQKWIIFAFDRTDNTPKTGDANQITANLRRDGGGASAVIDTNPAELEDGYYFFYLTPGETNGDMILICPASSTSNIQVIGVPGVVFTTAPSINTLNIANGAVESDVVKWESIGVTRSDLGQDNTIYVAKDGNDSNDGLTRGKAKLTMAGAVAALSNNWNLIVAPGEYDDALDLSALTDITVEGNGAYINTTTDRGLKTGHRNVVRDLVVESSNALGIGIEVGAKNDVRLERCLGIGTFDGAQAANSVRFRAIECQFLSEYDGVNFSGALDFYLKDCILFSDGAQTAPSRAFTAQGRTSGVIEGGALIAESETADAQLTMALGFDTGSITLINVRQEAKNWSAGATGNVCGVSNPDGNGTAGIVTLKGGSVETLQMGSGTEYHLNQASGVLAVDGSIYYDTAKTNGTITKMGFDAANDAVANVTLVGTTTAVSNDVTTDSPSRTASKADVSALALAATLALVKTKTDLITSANITVTSAVTSDSEIELVQYDDYLSANSRALSWTNTSGDWFAGDITGAAITLTLTENDGTIILSKAGSVVTATGTQEVSVDLTSAETGLFTKPGKQYKYQLLMVKATHRETWITGDVIVTLSNNEPS